MRIYLYAAIVLVGGCTRQHHLPTSSNVSCPTIAAPDAPYPKITYTTFVLDGKVIGVRQAQRVFGGHAPVREMIDTIPAVDKLDTRRIKTIYVLKADSDSARLFEPCPGVPVLMFESQRRWWWPW